MLKLALASGGNARAITSPYGGTALIAAAHLGHAEIVEALIAARAPVDHVNNLGGTALMEVIVLGDGGPRHRHAGSPDRGGADVSRPTAGCTPTIAGQRDGLCAISCEILEQAGARP